MDWKEHMLGSSHLTVMQLKDVYRPVETEAWSWESQGWPEGTLRPAW